MRYAVHQACRMLLCLLLVGWFVAGGDNVAAQSLDITQALLTRPELAAKIADLCNHVCAGNESKSWLEHATLTLGDVTEPMRAAILLKLRNRHVPVPGVVLYDDTADVTIAATLDPKSCEVQTISATSNNDVYRALLTLFRSHLRDAVKGLASAC